MQLVERAYTKVFPFVTTKNFERKLARVHQNMLADQWDVWERLIDLKAPLEKRRLFFEAFDAIRKETNDPI